MEVTADHSTATGNPDAMDSGEVRGRGRGQSLSIGIGSLNGVGMGIVVVYVG